MKFKLNETILEKILERYGLEPEDKVDYFLVKCPSCNQKEAYAYKDGNMVVCNRKKKCGNIVSVFALSKKITKDRDFIKSIAGEIGEERFNTIDLIETSIELDLPEGVTFFSETKESFMRNRAYNYLKKRKISDKVINELGYIYEPGSEYNKMIFIPFYEDKKLVYFITRDFSEKEGAKRYNNPRGISSKHFVYNLDKIEYNGTVFIFEGVFDAISLKKQVGTATLTDTLSIPQAIKILNKAPKNIVFVPDNDEAGRKSLNRNIKLMLRRCPPSLDLNIYIYYLENCKDFNESGKDKIFLEDCELFNEKKDFYKKIIWQTKNPF
jgi:hypothetical protein